MGKKEHERSPVLGATLRLPILMELVTLNTLGCSGRDRFHPLHQNSPPGIYNNRTVGRFILVFSATSIIRMGAIANKIKHQKKKRVRAPTFRMCWLTISWGK